MSDLEQLALRVEGLSGPCRETDDAIATLLFTDPQRTCIKGLSDEAGGMWMFRYPNGSIGSSLRFTGSVDAALTLVPATACNHDLSSFIGHGERAWGEFGWAFRFMDRAQLMGERAAKEEIARFKQANTGSWSNDIRGAPLVALKRAIAEHYVEFFSLGAATPALAIVAASLRARKGEG